MQTLVSIDMDDNIEAAEKEVDALFDYMDERVALGAEPEEVMAAIVVVLALVAGESGDGETVH
jgi:hypothetical protein